MSKNDLDERLLSPIQSIDPLESQRSLEEILSQHQQHLSELPSQADPVDRARIVLDMALAMTGLGRNAEAWTNAQESFDIFLAHEEWNDAVLACQVMYQSNQDDSIAALGQGVWLAVTYPVVPQLTVDMLHHIVDETPDNSDGAAVAAMTAHYIADLRTEGKQHENLTFLTSQLLAEVAKRHRGIEGQEYLDTWIGILELNDTKKLLSRLSTILDVIIGDKWWFDRDELRSKLPVN
ncbi:MAG: hypothetical protein V3S33_06180 [Gammaproteobacteria bacterium]